MKPTFSLLAALGVFVCATAVALNAEFSAKSRALHRDLIDHLPEQVPGWVVSDMDIASTEEMKKAVNELLNYDQALFREYRRGENQISVYVAHWAPRKFHPRLIAIHTPDVCWVNAGWTMDKEVDDYGVQLRSGAALPAQYREFTVTGTRSYVLYWHTVNGRLSGYASGRSSVRNSFVESLLRDLKEGAGEQFFIRLSSNRPWSEWESDPLFLSILETFSPVLIGK